jgi:hypothetical protein
MTAHPKIVLWLLVGLAAAGRAGSDGAPLVPAGAGTARPREVAELAAILARFSATDPIQVSLELQLSRQSMEEHWTDQSRATVEVEDGPQGIRVGLPRSVSRQTLQELRAQTLDPSKHMPTYNALQALTLNEVASDLDSAAALAQDLALAHTAEVQAGVTYLGKPARLVLLTLPPRLST